MIGSGEEPDWKRGEVVPLRPAAAIGFLTGPRSLRYPQEDHRPMGPRAPSPQPPQMCNQCATLKHECSSPQPSPNVQL